MHFLKVMQGLAGLFPPSAGAFLDPALLSNGHPEASSASLARRTVPSSQRTRCFAPWTAGNRQVGSCTPVTLKHVGASLHTARKFWVVPPALRAVLGEQASGRCARARRGSLELGGAGPSRTAAARAKPYFGLFETLSRLLNENSRLRRGALAAHGGGTRIQS